MTLVQPRRRARRFHRSLCVLLVGGVAATSACSRSTPTPAAARLPLATQLTETEIRDRDIEFYSARAKNDPTGATDLARLSALYLQRSRETGDPRDALRAEEAARRSLRNRRAHNDQSEQVLASSLLAQHRFDEALIVARTLRDRNPDLAPLRAAVGEIEMELGQYDSARVSFASVSEARSDLSVAPRLARWAEVEGHPDEARRLIRNALAIARRERTLPREQVAWFWLRAGDIDLRMGHVALADSAYRSGLASHPGDYRLLAAMCRVASMRRDWTNAVAYGEEAIASNMDPATLGMLSDAYQALGDSVRSREFAHVLDVAVLRQPGAYHRAWSLFLLDHDRHVKTVYEKIRTELRTRHDVYGYDLLAWALHKQGRDREAAAAMTIALSQGTRDGQLLYHAGVIERSLAHADSADRLLVQARLLNPALDNTTPAAR
jgi:tetratricopeptide (TPR) repeat protein